VSFGKAYKGQSVRDEIDKAVCPIPAPPPPKDTGVRAMLKAKYKFWAIVTYPNGRIEVAGGDKQEEVTKKVAGFKDAKVEYSWK
jgi:hypothetical protein